MQQHLLHLAFGEVSTCEVICKTVKLWEIGLSSSQKLAVKWSPNFHVRAFILVENHASIVKFEALQYILEIFESNVQL